MRHRIAAHALRLVLAATLSALAACAPAPIYKPAADTIDAPPFQVTRTPERYSGQSVIWGGRIVGVNNLQDASEVEVLAYPLDKSQRPRANDSGNGRFIAVMPGFVEPMDYPAGSLITVAGRLAGERAGKVGQADYDYPLVKVDQAHVWTRDELQKGRNNVHFGLGVGVGIR